MTPYTTVTQTLPTGVEVTECDWGRLYKGTRDALLASEIGVELRFPGDPGNRKVSQTYRLDGLEINVRKSSRGRFAVHVPVAREEQEKRRALRQLAQRRAHLTEQMNALPASSAEYRAWLERSSSRYLSLMLDCAAKGAGGYRLSRESIGEVGDALHDLTEALQRATIVLDRKKRGETLAIYRSEIAKVDPLFATFLATVTGSSRS